MKSARLQEMSIDVSVVIPYFNAEDTLSSCLDSVVKQSLNNIEILCVNDASTDSSQQIADNYAKLDTRIILLARDANKGTGIARNTGIDHSRGAFIFFVDADDLLPEYALETLLKVATAQDGDMVKGGLLWVRSGCDDCEITPSTNGKAVTTNIFESRYLQEVPTSNCCNLYRRSLVTDNNLRFRQLSFGEDHVFQTEAMLKSQRITLIDKVVYIYNNCNESSITKKLPSLNNMLDDFKFHETITSLFVSSGLYEAGMRFMKNWSFPYEEYWLKLARTFTSDDWQRFFIQLRKSIRNQSVVPWTTSTPYHHRYFLLLVLAELDQEAIDFISTREASTGFGK